MRTDVGDGRIGHVEDINDSFSCSYGLNGIIQLFLYGHQSILLGFLHGLIGFLLELLLTIVIILILLIQLAFGGQFIRIKRFGPGRRTTPPPRPSSPRTDVPASEDVIDAVAVDLPDEPVPPEKQIDRASSSE